MVQSLMCYARRPSRTKSSKVRILYKIEYFTIIRYIFVCILSRNMDIGKRRSRRAFGINEYR